MRKSKKAESAVKMWAALVDYIEQSKDDCDLGAGILTYEHLGSLIGYKAPAGQPAGQTVQLINAYCDQTYSSVNQNEKLPRMTAVVVSKKSGFPRWEEMFSSQEEAIKEQGIVKQHRWADEQAPTVEAMIEARAAYKAKHPN